MRFALRFNNYYLLVLYRLILIYVIYTLCRLFFILFNYSLLEPVSSVQLWNIMRGGLLFDTSAILYTNVLYLLLALLPLPFSGAALYQKILKWIYVVINFVAVSINIADTAYFRFTFRRTSSSFATEFTGDVKFFNIFIESISLYWYLFLLAFVLLFLLIFFSGNYKPKVVRRDFLFYAGRSFATLILVPVFLIGVRGGASKAMRPITVGNATDYTTKAIHAAAVLNTPFSIIRTIGKSDYKHQKFFSSYGEMEQIFTPVRKVGAQDSLYSSIVSSDNIQRDNSGFAERGSAKGKNILFIILEGFGYENMKFLNDNLDRSYTPFLDSLSRHSLVCTNAYANGRKSVDAMPSLFLSLPSMIQSFAVTPYSSNETCGLPKILDSLGYYSAFFHGAPNTSMGIRAVSRACGIKNYFGKDEYGNNDHFDGSWGIWDEHFLQYVAGKLDELPQPFFANIFTLSSHHPFKIPQEYQERFTEGTPMQRVIEYTDMALAKFFNKISREEWYANTLFVIVPDHSTLVGMEPEFSTTVGNTRIPLLYYSPGYIEPGIYEQITQQIDVMPTILGMIGYDKPYFAFGRDINSSLIAPFAVNYTEGQFQLIMEDYIYFRDNEKLKAIYNTANDPLLKNNLLLDDITAGETGSTDRAKVELQDKWFEAYIQQYINRLIDNKLTCEP